MYCSGAFFVTRFKSNAGLDVQKERARDEREHPQILGDQLVRFRNKRPGGKRINQYHGTPLRRVTVEREDGRPPLVLATNDPDTPAHIIAERYKARWGIELFFKWLKQNLRIRKFLGRSENAVKIQILCALIAYLLLVIYRNTSGFKGTLWALLSELRVTLFQRPTTDKNRYER